MLSRQGLTLFHKTYSIVQEDDDFLEKEVVNLSDGVFGTWVVEEKDMHKLEDYFQLVHWLHTTILGTLQGVVTKKLFGGKRRRRRRQYV